MTLKVGIIGCGKIADGHVEEIQKMPGVATVVGVCDKEPLMAEQIAARYGIAYHTSDIERLLAEQKPDVIHITTPPGSHLPLAKLSMDSGCHVYVEKPMTPSLKDTKALLAYADEKKKKVTIGYNYLFDPAAIEIRDIVKSGQLGEIVHVESIYGYGLAGPYGSAILADPNHWVLKLPGQLYHNNIDHLLCRTLDFVADDEPNVQAWGWVQRARKFGDGDDRDKMVDELRIFIRGKKTTIFGTFSSHVRPVSQLMTVYGTKNIAHVDYNSRTVTLEPNGSLPSAIGRLVPAFDNAMAYAKAGAKNARKFAQSDFQFFTSINNLFRAFYASITDGAPLPISYRDITRVSAALEEICRQAPPGGSR